MVCSFAFVSLDYISVATTRGQYWWGAGLQVNTFDLVSRDDYQLSLAGEGGCSGLMSRRGSVEGRVGPQVWCLGEGKGMVRGGMLGPQVWCPGGRWYTTMWPIPWCTWCTYPLSLWREWLIDRHLWKHYLPATLFAVGKNQVCYFVTGFVLFLRHVNLFISAHCNISCGGIFKLVSCSEMSADDSVTFL